MSSIPGAFAKAVKCPCCNNPWNQSSEDSTTTTSTAAGICNPCLTDNKGYKGIDPDNFDNSVSPAENFFLWSNGGWKAKNPIPAEYSSWNTFIVLRDLNLDRLKTILDELAQDDNQNTATSSADQQKLKDYFQSFMNESLIDSLGVSPLQELINLCYHAKDDITATIATLHAKYAITPFFSVYSTPDKANSEHSLCSLYQSGLGMGDRDYYMDEDKADKREKYLVYLTQIFSLLGKHNICTEYQNEQYCIKIANEILSFETQLATFFLTRTQSRDPKTTYNKMSVDQLKAQCRAVNISWDEYLAKGVFREHTFDWNRYFALIGKGVESLGDINVSSVTALTHFHKLLDSPIVEHYLLFHVINSFAPNLSSDFVQVHFQYHEKEMKGTAEMLPRWKRALQGLETALGDSLGQLYVSKYFAGDAKVRALQIVESVRDALRERLHEIPWMGDTSRQEALVKMEKFKVKIGYPDEWKDYSNLVVLPDQHIANVIASRQFEFQIDVNRMNAPTDKKRWFMTPQTVNAYYHPSLNEIVFPAAILQPPFFDPEADAAVQYGSLGAVVGHEMTHGFDDQGRKYDSQGNLRDWWTKEDGDEYERRASVMIKQAEAFEVYGLKLNGKLTCGENIADLGGVKLSLRALNKHLGSLETPAPLINGLTPQQRFFLAWSQSWRENGKHYVFSCFVEFLGYTNLFLVM